MQRTFTLEKETPGTFRYKEVEEGSSPIMCGAIYIKKTAFRAAMKSITVTVEQNDA